MSSPDDPVAAGDRAGPVPDVYGDPRPPPAPRTLGAPSLARPRATHHDPYLQSASIEDTGIRGPDGEPALESVRMPRMSRAADATLDAAWVAVLGGGYAFLLFWDALLHGDLTPVWITLGGFVVMWPFGYSRHPRAPAPIVAGARWVGVVGGAAVRTYELVRVREDLDEGGDVEPCPKVWLADRDHEVCLDPGLLESSAPLWALVYNGIRHSAAAGAEIAPATRARLRL